MSICLNILIITDVNCRDQELRFTVHESPDYYNLKVSVFNDDKKTDLVGETWVRLEEVITHGGGQSDVWHTLHCKGKYAGEIRIELTYYDSRPKMEKPFAKEENVDLQNQRQSYSKSEWKNVDGTRRRPLPAGPSNMARKSVLQSAVQLPTQARELDERHQNTHPNQGTIVEDPRSKYHHSWSYDVSQGSLYHNGRDPELLRDGHVENFGSNGLKSDKFYLANQHLTHEKSNDIYRSEMQMTNDAQITSGYTKYKSQPLIEQTPNLSAMRSRTEPVHTLHANSQQYHSSIALPENSMISEEYVSEAGKSQYHARQDATGPSDVPTIYMGENSVLSDFTRVGPPDFASAYSITAPHELNDINLHRQEDDNQYHSNSYGDRGNPNTAHIYNHLHRQNSLIQPEVDHTFSSPETSFDAQSDIPPPPPLHRIALNSSENGPSGQSENVVLAPIPLRHVRQEVSHRHSYPNNYGNSYNHAISGTSQDEVMQRSSQYKTPAAAHQAYESQQDIRSTGHQALKFQENQFRSSRTSCPNESSTEPDFPHLNTEALQQSIGKRPISLSIGGYQYEEDMCHSRNSQSAMMSPEKIGARKSLTHGDLTNPGFITHRDRASFSSQPRNSRETTPLTKTQVASPGMHHARSSNHSTPTRKSVSPQPSRSTATSNGTSFNMPFSPDSYENVHPSQQATFVSPVPHGENQVHNRSQGFVDSSSATTAAKSINATILPDRSQDEPIIGPDGRVIDPSDHLPVDSWAPEPERKNPHKPAPIRVRVSPRGAQPMPSSGKRENATRITAYSASPLSSSTTTATMSSASEMNAANDRSADPRVRTRLQKRPPGNKAAAAGALGSEGSGANTGGSMVSPPYEASGMSVPPIPAKVPVDVAVDVNGGSLGSDDLMALSEEMKSIDIGMGTRRSTGRMRSR